jgi:hypothetical protein
VDGQVTLLALEMPITFEGGEGSTQAINREEVRFVTDAILAPEQRLTGTLCFPADGDAESYATGFGPPSSVNGEGEVHARYKSGGTGSTVVYWAARVVSIEPLLPSGVFKVTARFTELAFDTLVVRRRRKIPFGRVSPTPAG